MLKKYSLLVLLLIIKLYLAAEPDSSDSSDPIHIQIPPVIPNLESPPTLSDVIDLTNETDFNAALSKYSVILVEFYAPWCGHCQAFAPEYEKAATQLKSNDPPITLAKVDCDSKPLGDDKCKEVGVPSLPTLKVFKNGLYYYEYNGERNATAVVEYMNKILGEASKQFQTPEELEPLLANASAVTILGFFERSCKTGQLFKDFLVAADRLRETVPFYHVFFDKFSKLKELFGENVDAKPCNIILVRPTEVRNKFEADYSVFTFYSGDIIEFIRANKHGLVGHKDYNNILDFELPIVNVYYTVNYEKNKRAKYWRNRVLKLATKYRDLTFVIADKVAFAGEIESFGLPLPKNTDPEPIVTARSKKGYKFPMRENFSVEAFEKFVDDFKNKRLAPFILSEELPTGNENAAIKVLVANNFEEMVLNVKKDHFILFYNPRDGYCKAVEPFYNQLGEAMRNEPEIQISKIDGTANDILRLFPFRGYPTLYFYSKNKTATLYEGERTFKEMLEFVAKQATNQLIGYDRDGNKIGGDAKQEL